MKRTTRNWYRSCGFCCYCFGLIPELFVFLLIIDRNAKSIEVVSEVEEVHTSASHIRRTHPIELTIESGAIRGEYLTIGANDFAIFKGIPYAAPPVGSLRFQKPEPPAKWRGVMNATQYPPMCAQRPRTRSTDPMNLYKIHISEDCLYLNVFAPPQVEKFNDETLL